VTNNNKLITFSAQSKLNNEINLFQITPKEFNSKTIADSPSIADSPCQSIQSDSPRKTVLFNETQLGHTKDQEDVVIAADEKQDMLRVVSARPWKATTHRKLAGNDGRHIAYAMPYEVRQFQLLIVYLHIDATADSNKEGWPLVTISLKDSYGKMCIVIRPVLPNEQSWSYKWFLSIVLPALIGKDVLKRINIIVTGGNSQEISQLHDAIATFFPDAYRIRCSWHIIDRGWHKKVKVALGGKSRKKRAPENDCWTVIDCWTMIDPWTAIVNDGWKAINCWMAIDRWTRLRMIVGWQSIVGRRLIIGLRLRMILLGLRLIV
jgi:hypothetical protein